MAGTHFQGYVAAKNGFYVGNKNENTQVIDENGAVVSGGVVKYAVLAIAYNTAGLATGVTVATIPGGAVVLDVQARITTAWNSGTTAAISVGYGASLNEFISGKDAKDTGVVDGVSGAVPAILHADNDVAIKVKMAVAGTAATAGAGYVTVTYTV